jgi:hypothetical protein
LNIEQIKDIKLNFILATARTGSTLLSSMLNTHPNVISTIEEPFAYSLYPKYSKIKIWTSETIQKYCYDFYLFSEGFLEIQFGTKKDLVTLLEDNKSILTSDIAIKLTYLCFFPNKDKTQISTIIDKQLRFHFCLEKVAQFYPKSKFIILYRDPRDQCLAKYRMSEKKNIKENYYRISNVWNYVYETLYQAKIKIGNSRFLEIKYEDLVLNPEFELNKICSFLDIPYYEIMLKYDEQIKKEVSITTLKEEGLKEFTIFHEGLRQKVNTNKIGFWKQGLKEEEVNIIWTVCGSLAEKIGYKKKEVFVKQKLKLNNYLTFLYLLVIRTIAALYYYSPFYFKWLIKKIKYSKKFKTDGLTNKEFYKTSYHNN